ncbi:MAG: hypothetical protein V3R77_04160 [Candidatus Binatia bacterium]
MRRSESGSPTLGIFVLMLACALLPACGYNPALKPELATNLIVPSEDGVRSIKTVLVVDPWWHRSDSKPVELMHRVSDDWERAFGIRFEIVEVVRDRIGGLNSVAKLKALVELYPAHENRQLVLLFTGSTGMLTLEVTDVLGNHIVICPSPVEASVPIIHHGLGHVFGAPHSLLPGNYMTAWALPILSTQTASLMKFSDTARETIVTNKWRIFTLDEQLAQGELKPRFGKEWVVVSDRDHEDLIEPETRTR